MCKYVIFIFTNILENSHILCISSCRSSIPIFRSNRRFVTARKNRRELCKSILSLDRKKLFVEGVNASIKRAIERRSNHFIKFILRIERWSITDVILAHGRFWRYPMNKYLFIVIRSRSYKFYKRLENNKSFHRFLDIRKTPMIRPFVIYSPIKRNKQLQLKKQLI